MRRLSKWLQFKRIQTKLLVFLIPMFLLVTFSLVWVSYSFAKELITKEIQGKMENQLQKTIYDIQGRLQAHVRIPESLARIVEANGTKLSAEDYRAILVNLPTLNEDTLGVGVWYESNLYRPGQKYFGPYAYKDSDKVVYTEDYMKPDYDYQQWDWYKNGLSTTQSVVFTDPYYDETINTTMITASVPFYDAQKKVLGVTTGDISLSRMQKMISEIQVGSQGWAFMMDQKGMLIADRDEKKVMKTEISKDANASLAALGTRMLENLKSNQAQTHQDTFEASGELVHVFYAKIPETGWELALAIPDRELFASLQKLLLRILIVIIAALIVITTAIIVFSRKITRNIQKLNDLSFDLREGRFDRDVEIGSKDELGRMGDNFNSAIGVLREMMGSIAQSAQEVAVHGDQLKTGAKETIQATEEITTSMQLVAEGADKEAGIVRSSKQTAVEISQGMEQIAASVELVCDSSMQAMGSAKEGNIVVQDMIRQIQTIHSAVSESSQSVQQLQEKSRVIDEIVTLITSIASQTSLFSLNAAIEAARAGEAGRGFAVVAGEVRKLADQSAAAAGQISGIILEIQGTVNDTAFRMQAGRHAVVAGMELSSRAGESFSNIVEAITTVSYQTEEVSAAVEQIYSSTENMVGSMEEIVKLTQQTAGNTAHIAAATQQQTASIQQVSATAEQISMMAFNLRTMLQKFRYE